MTDRGNGALKARHLLTKIGQKANDAVLPALGEYGVVSVVSGNLVAVRLTGDTGDASQLIARLAGPTVAVGEPVVLIPMRGGGYVAAKIGGVEGGGSAFNGGTITNALVMHNGADLRTYSDAGTTLTAELDAATGRLNLAHGVTLNNVPIMGAHIQAGRIVYFTNLTPVGTLAGVALTANRMYYVPIFVPADISSDAFVFEVTTAVSGSVQCGLYTATSALLPGTRLSISTKTAVSTIGVKSFAMTPYAVQGGRWYFVGLCSTTAMSLRGSVTVANLPSPRGGATSTQAFLMASETLAGGWANIPTTASPGSLANTYLHMGIQAS
jgi:hypothetical protein